MAANNVNAVVKFFENGGVVTITDGVDTFTLKNLMPGSAVKITVGIRERLPYYDRNVMQPPLVGKELPTRMEFELRIGSGVSSAATELLAKLMEAGSGDVVNLFTNTIVQIPDSRGGATGHRLTQTNTYLADMPRYESGETFDKFTFALETTDAFAGFIAY